MRIIVGVTGASGVIMSYYLLQALKEVTECQVHLVVTKAAKVTWDYETNLPLTALTSLADVVYGEEEVAASIASGTFITDGMIVLPCSMKTLAGRLYCVPVKCLWARYICITWSRRHCTDARLYLRC